MKRRKSLHLLVHVTNCYQDLFMLKISKQILEHPRQGLNSQSTTSTASKDMKHGLYSPTDKAVSSYNSPRPNGKLLQDAAGTFPTSHFAYSEHTAFLRQGAVALANSSQFLLGTLLLICCGSNLSTSSLRERELQREQPIKLSHVHM